MKSTIPLNPDEFITAISDSLLVWLEQQGLMMMLAQPPLRAPAGVSVMAVEEPLLKSPRGRRVAGNLVAWPRLGLEAKPNPFLAFVLEGVVDLSIGVTESMAMEAGVEVEHGVYHIRMPRQGMLIYPQNIPHSDGLRPHWEGTDEQPESTVLWIDILPEGALLHTCHTRSRAHVQGSTRFVFDPRLPLLFDSLVEEWELAASSPPVSPDATEITRAALRFFLLRVVRSLSQQPSHHDHIGMLYHNTESNDRFFQEACHTRHVTSTSAVKRARDFIHGRLGLPLTVATVARHTHVSPGHLNRLFRADLGMSVMEYVYEQRLETAKSLLVNTTLPINVIAKNIGVTNSAYFSRMFREKTGMSPQLYRSKNLNPPRH